MMQATIYSRWSSLEQGKGTSAERQQERNSDYCRLKGWQVAERITDEGRSAWTGDNIANGNLATYAARIRREGGAGKVLVVEKLDRLSRQAPLRMAAWLQDMVATGLTIATADGRHTITADDLARNQMQVLGVIFEAFRGFDESQSKSDRVADAWRKKRERGAPMSKRCPAWLRPAGSTSYKADQSASRYELYQDRAELIRWMFEQSAAGVGAATIEGILNARGEPTWGSGDGWHASYIKKILANRACIGVYQPHVAPKGGGRKPVGEPLADYFPAVVPIDLFESVNDKRAQRVQREQSGHHPLVNLLSGLAHCDACGGTMTLLDKGNETLANGTTVPRRYLKCSRVHRSLGGCDNRRSVPYGAVESAILDHLLHLAMDDQHFASPENVGVLEAEIARLTRDRKEAERKASAAFAMVEDDGDDELAQARYRQHRETVKNIKVALSATNEKLADARGTVSPAEHIRRVADVRAMMTSTNEAERYQARRRIKLALNDLVEDVRLDASGNAMVHVKSSLRLTIIRTDGKVLDFDLKHPARDNGITDPAIRSYLARRDRHKAA